MVAVKRTPLLQGQYARQEGRNKFPVFHSGEVAVLFRAELYQLRAATAYEALPGGMFVTVIFFFTVGIIEEFIQTADEKVILSAVNNVPGQYDRFQIPFVAGD